MRLKIAKKTGLARPQQVKADEAGSKMEQRILSLLREAKDDLMKVSRLVPGPTLNKILDLPDVESFLKDTDAQALKQLHKDLGSLSQKVLASLQAIHKLTTTLKVTEG